MEENNEKLVDITKPIKRPANFDELLALSNHYEDMETIIESLGKTPNSCIVIDEDNDNKDADSYSLDPEYSVLFIEVLKSKMKEIRNVLNFN